MKLNKKTIALSLAALLLAVSGCIVSGTFIIVEPFDFTTQTGFYHYKVDITDEQDWKDHKDDINDIEVVGFELWFNNPSASEVTFNCWIDDANDPEYTDTTNVVSNATRVLSNLTLPVGDSHLTYGQSLKYVMNVPTMKTLVKTGKFHFYGASDGLAGRVDSGKVIVTFGASGS